MAILSLEFSTVKNPLYQLLTVVFMAKQKKGYHQNKENMCINL